MANVKFRARPRVALLIETSRAYGREILRGVARYARTHTNWALLHQEMTIDARMPDWMAGPGVRGVIARVDAKNVETLQQLDVPIVDVRCSHRRHGIPCIETDDRRVAELAFAHLWERGFRRFAFCGFQFAHYSQARCAGFADCVAKAKCQLTTYLTPSPPGASLSTIEQADQQDTRPMRAWLETLEPPTGLFVCNDIRGQQVLNACRNLGIAVPDDLAVIGADDDDTICPLSDPPLSSVCPDADQIGWRAAETLHRMLHGDSPLLDIEYVPPLGVSQRLSTQVMAVEDRELARICRFIREHACDGIDVNDLAEITELSRRQVERRFRTLRNRTPLQEITAVRIARVKQLLVETDLTLDRIAPLAGFSHKERLSAVFKRETGLTPGEFRRL